MAGPFECPRCKNYYYGPQCPYCGYAPDQEPYTPYNSQQEQYQPPTQYQQSQYQPPPYQAPHPPPPNFQQPPLQYPPPPQYQAPQPQYQQPPDPGSESDIVGKYELAGILKRFVALIIDMLIIGGIFGIVIFVALGSLNMDYAIEGLLMGTTETIIFSLSLIAFMLLYWTILEGSHGKTLGKSILNIKVVKEDGSKMDIKSALVRNLLRVIDQLPGNFYIIGLILILASEKEQRLGDLAAKTLVVSEKRQIISYAPYPPY